MSCECTPTLLVVHCLCHHNSCGCNMHRNFLNSLIFWVTSAPVFHLHDYLHHHTCLQETQMFGVTEIQS